MKKDLTRLVDSAAPFRLLLHRNLERILDDLEFSIGRPGFPTIHAIIGPTGVGKTTLLLTLRDRINERFVPKDGQDRRSCVPVVPIKAEIDGNLKFSWKDCILQGLQVLNPALTDYGKMVITQPDGTQSLKSLERILDLQEQFESSVEHRQTKLLFIDEAQQVLSGRREELLRIVLDKIKLLTEKVPITVVLFGTYELNPISQLNGQLARRCEVHHFARYNHELKEDRHEFGKIVRSFAKDKPVFDSSLLDEKMLLIHFGCFGCPGIAVEWLERVEARAEREGARKAVWEFFEREKIKKTRYNAIGVEIADGEAEFEEDELELVDGEEFTSLPERQSSGTDNKKRIRDYPNRPGRPRRAPKNDLCPARD